MKHSLLLSLTLCILHLPTNFIKAQGSFAPAVGYTGTTAVYSDSSALKSWATGIELTRGWVNISNKTYTTSGSNKTTYGKASVALQKADNSVVSIGDSGVALLTFNRPIINGDGPDFAVYENGFFSGTPKAFLELGFVEVSSDGSHFVRFPATSEVPYTTQVGPFATINASYLNNLAGKYTAKYGTPFDLDDVKDSANLDINNIRLIKIIDVIGNINTSYSVSYDSKGNIINDPFPTPYYSSGFDLDAVGVINGGDIYSVASFADLNLGSDTFWNPQASGIFTSGIAKFPYNYSTYSWDGFVYSNKTDVTTATYTNQYSAITGGGIDGSGTNYAVSYISSDWTTYNTIPDTISFTDNLAHNISGFYATNSTYGYYTMKNGSAYSKVFGGSDGKDADWFKLDVWGIKEDGTNSDTVKFYLADYRNTEDSAKNYIVDNWRWVDLAKLGKVKKLLFNLNSSDAGTYGMNTPAYFCMDNLTIVADTLTITPIADITKEMNSAPETIDLKDYTTADDTTGITYSISYNSNSSVVSTNISNKILNLNFATDQYGVSDIALTSTLRGKTVIDTFRVTINNSNLTILKNSLANSVKVYPNPFSSKLNVDCELGSYISVFDLCGRKLIDIEAVSSSTNINTEKLSSGYYIVEIKNASDSQKFKILKK